MRIIGGTYLERTVEPLTEHIYGSGGRAAAALAGVLRPHLITCVDSRLRPYAQGIAETYGVDLTVVDRNQPVVFSYDTPLSAPRVSGGDQSRRPITSSDTSRSALVFGMLESACSVTASAIVYDPQGPQDAGGIDRGPLVAERFAVVGNVHEITALGRSGNVAAAARQVAAEAAAEVVVVKRGALGSLVVEAGGGTTAVGPYRTETVWPIGSGDVFSAAFAWAWLEDGRDAVTAATLASAATAAWCGTQTLPIPLAPSIEAAALLPDTALALAPEEVDVPIYLAGPFFNVSQRWLINLVRQALTHLGAHVFSPLHDVGRGSDEVAVRDLDGMRASKALFGILDGADAGTLYEFGYAAARGLPAVGYAAAPGSSDYTMARGMGTPILNDLPSAVYRAIWAGMTQL